MKDEIRILILEDEPQDAEIINRELRKNGLRFSSRCVMTKEEFMSELECQAPDVILSDHGLPTFDGFAALKFTREKNPDIPFIFVTGSVGEEKAIEAFELGASDYVLKSKISNLAPVVQRTLHQAESNKNQREHERHLRLILESAKSFAIFTMDMAGRITTWNAGAKQLFGYDEDEVVGHEAKIIFTPEDLQADHFRGELRKAIDKGQAENERWHVRKGGERFWGSGLVMPFLNTRGEPSGYLKILRDATEEHQMRGSIARSAELYRSMVDTVENYAIYMLDSEGRVETWNSGAERIEGYRAEEIIGRHFSIFFPPEEKDLPTKELERATTTGRSQTEAWAVRKDGSRFWSNWTLTPVRDQQGQLKGFVKIAHDMTQRKNAEEEIRKLTAELEMRVSRRTAQLEASNHELEAFSYSVSHDLRAPLRHISAYVELLKENIGGDVLEDSQLYLDKIATSAGKMGQLIDDLLTFSRMARTEMRFTSISLFKLVQEARSEFHEEIKGRDIDWIIGDLPEIKGDPVMLRQVFINLISNALKYTHTRQRAQIEIGSTSDERQVTCFVRDNGAGFDMHFSQKLFGVFQRLHSDKEFPGTGIGLAIVRRVIHRHGGEVWAEGAIGSGATFYFSLPKI
jgi:PAS domain S-box-containing protein